VTAQLIDAETGRHIWADRYDRDLADIFEMQDEISQAMVEALAPAISQAERQRAMKRPPENLGAWEAYQRALWYWARQSDGSFHTVRTLLEQAVSLDPRFGQPHAWLALIHLSEATLGTVLPLQEGFKRAETEARMAVRLDPDNGMNHAMLAWVLDHQGRMVPAREEAEIAVALNPNDPSAQMALGRILTFTGRIAEGRSPLKIALRLDPYGPTAPSVMHHLGLGSYFERDYQSALANTQRAIKDFPGFVRPYPVLAAALGQIGQTGEARTALNAAIVASSTYFATLTSSRLAYYRPQDHEHLLEGLRKAGWKD
jgi:adenylate cyclase